MNKSEASRENGSKSNGPFTEEGKQISSQNSLKHGLYSEKVVLTEESHQEFDHFHHDYISYYMPVGPIEKDLVKDLAENRWRLRRCAGFESGVLVEARKLALKELGPDDAFAIDAFVVNYTMGPKGVLRALHRQEARMRRACERADMDLRRIQAARLAPAMAEAAAERAENNKVRNEPKDPTDIYIQACLRGQKTLKQQPMAGEPKPDYSPGTQ